MPWKKKTNVVFFACFEVVLIVLLLACHERVVISGSSSCLDNCSSHFYDCADLQWHVTHSEGCANSCSVDDANDMEVLDELWELLQSMDNRYVLKTYMRNVVGYLFSYPRFEVIVVVAVVVVETHPLLRSFVSHNNNNVSSYSFTHTETIPFQKRIL